MEATLLNYDLEYPFIPPPPSFPGISKRRDRWPRQAIVLWLIAQGFSLRVEIQHLMAAYFGLDRRSGGVMSVIPDLRNAGMLQSEAMPIQLSRKGMIRFDAVRLTEIGKELMRTYGWSVYEGEWERMQRLHEKGNNQSRHTAAVLAFVYQARLRGWAAGVIPEVDAGRFYPDAVVAKNGELYYLEVELNAEKPSKWHNMARHQGVIALCARTPEHRRLLMIEAKPAAEAHKCTRLGTDLRTLFERVYCKNPLWLEKCSGPQKLP